MATDIPPPQRHDPLEPKRTQRRHLLRLFSWGAVAFLALAGAVLTSQTEAGASRLRQALSLDSEPVPVVAALPAPTLESSAEAKRLATQVRELAADRDRLTARIVTLEHSLDDMTGSIKRQDQEIAAARTSPPVPSAPATTAAQPPANLPYFLDMRTPHAAVPPLSPQPEPTRVATVAPKGPAAEPQGKAIFAIDLGGAATLDALRIHWAGLKANYGPVLDNLQPRVTEHAKQPGGLNYRLVAGPLASADEAARVCARLQNLRTGCRTTQFTGAELAAH